MEVFIKKLTFPTLKFWDRPCLISFKTNNHFFLQTDVINYVEFIWQKTSRVFFFSFSFSSQKEKKMTDSTSKTKKEGEGFSSYSYFLISILHFIDFSTMKLPQMILPAN